MSLTQFTIHLFFFSFNILIFKTDNLPRICRTKFIDVLFVNILLPSRVSFNLMGGCKKIAWRQNYFEIKNFNCRIFFVVQFFHKKSNDKLYKSHLLHLMTKQTFQFIRLRKLDSWLCNNNTTKSRNNIIQTKN